MTIVVCIPGNSFSSEFFIRWTIFLQYCQQKGIKLILSQQHSNNIYYVRNMCLGGNTILGINQKPFNSKIEYDYILWIDSDIIFTPEQFEKLIFMLNGIAEHFGKRIIVSTHPRTRKMIDEGKLPPSFLGVHAWTDLIIKNYSGYC